MMEFQLRGKIHMLWQEPLNSVSVSKKLVIAANHGGLASIIVFKPSPNKTKHFKATSNIVCFISDASKTL